MGILRFLLALSVVVGHAKYPPIAFGNARVAVQVFFIISGFLISFVLNTNRQYDQARVFYANRFLRIYPIYIVLAFAVLIMWSVEGDRFARFMQLTPTAQALVVISNILIVGQDALLFLQQSAGGLAISWDFRTTDPQLWTFALIPPAWSLSLELMFYLLAPVAARRLPVTLALFAGSLCLTAFGVFHGLRHDPWNYRFFPFELWLFLLGVLSERLWRPIVMGQRPSLALPLPPAKTVAPYATAFAALAFVAFGAADLPEPVPSVTIFAVIAVLMPWLFVFQHGRKWDIAIGDLSYPLYVCHWPVLVLLGVRSEATDRPATLSALGGILLSILLAWVLEATVSKPVERLRHRIRQADAPVDALDAETHRR